MSTPALNEALFWREDLSLRAFLNNQFTVSDLKNPTRQVPAYFRMPEAELKEKDFPYLLIDPLGPVFDPGPGRAMQGSITLPPIYLPDGAATDGLPVDDVPVPLQLRYDVSSNCRFMHHDYALLQQMSVYLLRFGAMNTIAASASLPGRPVAIRDDMSRRRIDVLNGPVQQFAPDPQDAHARIFRRVWTLGVSAEIFLSDITTPGVADTIVIDPATQPGFESLT